MSMRRGFVLKLSNGQEFKIVPEEGVEQCTVSRGDVEITLVVDTGEFNIKQKSIGVVEFLRAELDVTTDNIAQDNSNIGVLWCRVSGCCCNCGDGWTCG